MADVRGLCADLADEHASLEALVAGLDPASWDKPTPAEPWSVRDQISHLAFFDEQASLAVTSPEDFWATLPGAAADPDAFIENPLERGRAVSPAEVLEWWGAARRDMLEAFATVDPAIRIPWYGPPMSPASFITARLMETWAHGQDIADGLAVRREATARLRHIAYLGVRARPFSYAAHDLVAPEVGIRLELEAPDGEMWSFGPEDATERVLGSALGFCLIVTQRRHPADTDVVTEGPAATEWIGIAQCFAGPPGQGRAAGQFAKEPA